MRSWLRHVILLLTLSGGTAVRAAEGSAERYQVIAGGTVVGHLRVEPQDGAFGIDYDYKNNGRGPTLRETLRLDTRGLPSEWTLQGATTFGSPIDEQFTLRGQRARWSDAGVEGSATVAQPSLYVAQSASPWALGVYARALLQAEGQELLALPGGSLRLEAGETLQVSGDGGPLNLRRFAVSGLDLNPSYLLLDDSNALFASLSGGFIVIREGYEGEEKRLRERAAQWAAERLAALTERHTHRFDAPLRIRNVRVFDPEAMALGPAVSVLVHGRRIAGVQPLDAPGTPGEVLIEGEGGTVMPGMFEMHAHTAESSAFLNVLAGVTSMRDMGNNNTLLTALVARIEAGELIGPRITRSGFIEGRSPFSSNNGIVVDSQQAAIDAVRWYAARGFWQVKLYNSMDPGWNPAVIAEAHRLGMRVSGHVPAFSNADAMIDAGYDELTHINQIMLGWVLEPDEDTRTLLRITALKRLAGLDLDSPRVQRTLDRLIEHKVAVEPTIGIHEAAMLGRAGEVPVGRADYFDHLPIGAQRSARQAWLDLSEEGDDAAYRASYQVLLDTLRRMHQRGVLLIPGTDLGGGFTFHRELELLQSIGMSPAQALRRATLDMAEYLGQGDQLGSIGRGKLADFFLIPGDPTLDLKAIKTIRMVVKDGLVYFPSEIYPAFGIRPFVDAPTVVLPVAAVAPTAAAVDD